MEAPPGFEPGMKVLQTSALPLGDGAVRAECEDPGQKKWSGKRDSNPRLRPWQGRTLPLSYSRSSNFENYGNTRLQPSSRRLAVPALARPRHQMGRLRRYAELFGVSRRVRPSSKTTRVHEGVDHDFHPRPPRRQTDRRLPKCATGPDSPAPSTSASAAWRVSRRQAALRTDPSNVP